MKKFFSYHTMAALLAIVLPLCIHAQTFVHPGIPFTQSDLNQLKAALENLKHEVAPATNNVPNDPGPDPSKVRAYWSKDQLAFAGHADQSAALQSTLWALTRGDTNAIVSAIEPTAIKELWSYSTPTPSEADLKGTSEAAITSMRSHFERLAESLRPVTGFYVISDNLIPKMPEMVWKRRAEDYAIYKVYFAGEGATRAISLKRSNDQWKLTGILVLDGTEDKPTYDMTLWP